MQEDNAVVSILVLITDARISLVVQPCANVRLAVLEKISGAASAAHTIFCVVSEGLHNPRHVRARTLLSDILNLEDNIFSAVTEWVEYTVEPLVFKLMERAMPAKGYVLIGTNIERRSNHPDTTKVLKDIYAAYNAEGNWL